MTRFQLTSAVLVTLISAVMIEASTLRNTAATKVYLNGAIYTIDTDTQWDTAPKQAIVISGKDIVYVGSTAEAENYIVSGKTKVIDLHGSVVLPGFHDVHMHPIEAMSLMDSQCTLPKNTRPDDPDFESVFSTCTKKKTNCNWILGGGYSVTEMLEYEFDGNSPKDILDKFIPDRPAAMLEETSHSAWANSLALQEAGIDSSTPERPGGVIMRKPGTNEPSGILFENEAMAIFALAKNPKTNPSMASLNVNGLNDGLYTMAQNGITSFCDARLFWKINQHLAYQQVCDNGGMTARAVLDLWAYPHGKDSEQIQTLKSLYSKGSNRCSLRRTQIKVYMDGIIESTTSAMLDKFKINLSLPIISEKNIGLNYFDKARLEKYLRALQDFGHGDGFDFNIHAVGDRGIREALDAIEAAQRNTISRTPRHRITHVELLSPDDVKRFHELGVIADFQVAGTFTLPPNHKHLTGIIGKDKAEFSIPIKSVVETGATVTLSSDWDVSPINPFIGLKHATERGDQSISVKEAIEMYTTNSAFAMRQEAKVGKLMPGMEADLVVIDTDVLKVNPSEIGSTRVLETLSMGESVYKVDATPLEDISTYY